ncbi:hypothetical protein SAMN06265222_101626 [Neorhodopirellula lusitana]|uniref:Uncharacterized protein n=1 Tax=Neorhodopirellula lusitana TaxID=445327 RepID=A0ABY1PR06_9BACT|nr:hypothetical protein [Neorhodopirellula lusitana]SMP41614.1 hypothetical protein SAMN06265222_101626 [Neorhodopirellula lusitana]
MTEDIPDIYDLRRRIADRLREVRTLRAIERAVERHRREAESHEHVRHLADVAPDSAEVAQR